MVIGYKKARKPLIAKENNALYPINSGTNEAYIVNADTRPQLE